MASLFLSGIFHLFILVIYDVYSGEKLLDDGTTWILVWLLWPVFDAALIGLSLKELLIFKEMAKGKK